MTCTLCGKPTKRRARCRSCALRAQWAAGSRRKTILSLQKTYSDPQRRRECAERMRRLFQDEERRREHAKRMQAAEDAELKSRRMKDWWTKPQNRRRMLRKFQSLRNGIRISTGMRLAGGSAEKRKVVAALRKLGIPFARGHDVAFQRFDFLLWPGEAAVLLDVGEEERTSRAKQQMVTGLLPNWRYTVIKDAAKIEETLLGLA